MIPFLALTILFALPSCNGEPEEPMNPSANPGNPTPTFDDMDGLFAAIQVISYQSIPVLGDVAVYADVATSAIIETGTSYLDGGNVSVNGYQLEKLDNNAYVLPSTSAPATIDFDYSANSDNTWAIAGNGIVTGFNHTTSQNMPGDIKFDTDYSTVNPGTDLVVSIESSPANTDSILFVVAFNTTTLTKTVGPGTLSATFSAADLNGASGTGVVQAAAYNYDFEIYNSKKYYFINESVVTQIAQF